MPPRDYARLHFDWYRDAVLEEIAAEEPAALWIWPVLIGMAKEKSHATTNPTGAFERSAAGIAKASHVPVDQVKRALELLAEGEFITTSPAAKPRVLRIEIDNFSKWQTPRKGKAEQQQARRDASREKKPSRGGSVGGALPSVVLETETKTKEKELSLLSNRASDDTADSKTRRKPRTDHSQQVDDVFAYWCKVEAATGGQGSKARGGRKPTLTNDRRKVIVARLNEGIDPDTMKKAIAFYARDPYHVGVNDQGRRYTDLTTTLKSGSKVEQGAGDYEQRRAGPDAGTGGVDEIEEQGY